MTRFNSYSPIHGNAQDWCGIVLSSTDAEIVREHGYQIGMPISATGYVGEGEKGTRLVLSSNASVDRLRVYAEPKKDQQELIFRVDRAGVTLHFQGRERQLTPDDDIWIDNMRVAVEGREVVLISTQDSKLRPSKKRKLRGSPPRVNAQPSTNRRETKLVEPSLSMIAEFRAYVADRLSIDPQKVRITLGVAPASFLVEILSEVGGRQLSASQ